jgi:hypothetical protein
MKTFKGALALLLLTGFILALSLNLFAQTASGYADFNTWANRSSRSCEPVGYNASGTACCQACSWRGVRGVGNVGIGDGNVSLMLPSFANDAMKAFNEGPAANETSFNMTAGNATVALPESATGNDTIISNNIGTGTCSVCDLAAASDPALVETLTPSLLLAAGVVTEGTPYGITLGRPMPHILNENPVETGVLYGKMYGLTMPSGQRIDFGVKSIGYEY